MSTFTTLILQNAQVVDPEGLRTIAVITKPDLIDEGSEQGVIDLLLNRRRSLHWGYHVVKLRGQQDLNKKVTLPEALQKEAKFFNSKPIWREVPKNLVGVANLKVKLVELLQDIVIKSLPAIIQEIDDQLE
jgi:interferon-induced GTP-binding protein Mx1